MNTNKFKSVFLIFLVIIVIFSLMNFSTRNNHIDKVKHESSDNFPRGLETSTSVWSRTSVVSSESTRDSYRPSIAVDSYGNIHIAWYDNSNYSSSGTDLDIFYKFWNATTGVWNTTTVVSTESTDDSGVPSIAVDSYGNIHIAWFDYTDYGGSGGDPDIFYKYWNTTTGVWDTTTVVSTESTGFSQNPSIAVDSFGNAHIAWRDGTDYGGSGTDQDIFYKYWNSTTGVWNTTLVVSIESTEDSEYPSMAVDGSGNVHVAWNDYTDYGGSGTDQDIFYKYWNATTGVWNTTLVVSIESTEDSEYPSIAVDGAGNVHIAWEDDTNYGGSGIDPDIFYKYWNATTGGWDTTTVVSTEIPDISANPSIAVDGSGNVHIAWRDGMDYGGSGGDYDIFYKFWNATTGIWSTTTVVSTESTSNSYYPSIVVDGSGNVHISWYDPSSNIFHKGLIVHDIISPFWVQLPINQTVGFDVNFTYDLNAYDLTGINSWWINDTTQFSIDGNGIITNIISLAEGVYWLEVRAYDPFNNNCSAIFKITVMPPSSSSNGGGGGGKSTTETINTTLVIIVIIIIGILGAIASGVIYSKRRQARESPLVKEKKIAKPKQMQPKLEKKIVKPKQMQPKFEKEIENTTINTIRKTVLELGTKYTRLQIVEIIEKTGIKDENLIIETIQEMIDKKEIYAEYFASSKSIVFDQQANIDEIDKLMKVYKEWEDKKDGKL